MSRMEPADVLLVIDIGNSRIALGLSDSDGVHDVQRVPVSSPAAWEPALRDCWAAAGRAAPQAAVIASVVPDLTPRIVGLVEEFCGLSPVRVGDDVPLPISVKLDNPEEVGVDRVCAAAAAYERVGQACAVASFGTAITIDCVSAAGEFLGGTILPGLTMSCDALHDHTAQLPRVKPAKPAGPFGRNTHDAIVGGVSYAAVGALREIVERFATELREWPHLVITGGDAGIIKGLADFVDSAVPDLSLMGIALAYRQAAGAGSPGG